MSSTWSHYENSLDCVHCGLCLQVCPTYTALGFETDSPRGRIYLMRALAEERISDVEQIRGHLDQCLGCRACESACPSGVQYGHMLDQARSTIGQRYPHRRAADRLRHFLLRYLLAKPARLRLAFTFLRGGEVLGLRWLATRLGLLPGINRQLVPRVPGRRERRPLVGSHEPKGKVRGTVALFTGCVMEQVFGAINKKTLDLLLANGFRVEVPASQVCCGSLLVHDGQMDRARELAEKNTQAFEDAQAIIHNSAGCGATLLGYGELLQTAAGESLAKRSRDITDFLCEVGLERTPAPFPHRVAYDDPCHLYHAQGVHEAPRALLAQVPEIQLVSHREPETCCGSAGIYNLVHRELAAEIGRKKAAALIASGAEVIATGNPGCMMQVQAHLRLGGSQARVLHPVELLLPEP